MPFECLGVPSYEEVNLLRYYDQPSLAEKKKKVARKDKFSPPK